MSLPFTADQFFEVFAEYNRAFWPAAVALWLYAAAAVALLARRGPQSGWFVSLMLAVQWAWAALGYHAMFFTSINTAAWLFGGLFFVQSTLLAWYGVVRGELNFSEPGSPRHAVAAMLILYSLIYPLIVALEGHTFPAAPSFGVPCPTTLLTVGVIFAADPPWPRIIAVVPILWAFIAGSAAVLLGVHADLMLWVAGAALAVHVLLPPLSTARA